MCFLFFVKNKCWILANAFPPLIDMLIWFPFLESLVDYNVWLTNYSPNEVETNYIPLPFHLYLFFPTHSFSFWFFILLLIWSNQRPWLSLPSTSLLILFLLKYCFLLSTHFLFEFILQSVKSSHLLFPILKIGLKSSIITSSHQNQVQLQQQSILNPWKGFLSVFWHQWIHFTLVHSPAKPNS